MKPTDEYKICSLEEAEEFAKKRMENPYELADELLAGGEWSMRAQAMLRYQADRIAELENQLDKCSHHEAMAHQGGYEIGRASQIKELSDDEIEEFAYAFELWQLNNPDKALEGIKDFARAILRKAQKK